MAKREPKLFIAVHAAGIAYCDTSREEDGDYVKVAFLSYATLNLDVYRTRSPLLNEIRDHAAGLRAMRGQPFSVDASGHTVILGRP